MLTIGRGFDGLVADLLDNDIEAWGRRDDYGTIDRRACR
jgi:hypothetical protein